MTKLKVESLNVDNEVLHGTIAVLTVMQVVRLQILQVIRRAKCYIVEIIDMKK